MARDSGDDRSLSQHSFLVIGGSGGIGSALTERLTARGADVLAAARDAERPTLLSCRTGARTATVDATEADEVDDLVRDAAASETGLSGIALAVGSILIRPAHLTSPEDFRRTLSLKLESAFFVVRIEGSRQSTCWTTLFRRNSATTPRGIRPVCCSPA